MRAIGVPLICQTSYPCIPAPSTFQRELAEPQFVPVSFDVFSKLMPMDLLGDRKARSCYIAPGKHSLHIAAKIVAGSLERLNIWLLGGGKHSARNGTTRPVLIDHAAGQQCGPAVLVVP